jgi:hypothetical protein
MDTRANFKHNKSTADENNTQIGGSTPAPKIGELSGKENLPGASCWAETEETSGAGDQANQSKMRPGGRALTSVSKFGGSLKFGRWRIHRIFKNSVKTRKIRLK